MSLAGISAGPTNENQTVTLTATSSNPALIPNPGITYASPGSTGTLVFTQAVNGFGSATITVTANDGQGQNNLVTQTFTVTVNHVNQSPTLDPLGNLTVNENAAQQTVNLSGITPGATNESELVAVTATSSNPALIPNPVITYSGAGATGTLSFTPAVNGYGTATITVTANDGQAINNKATRTFTVTVNHINQAPTLAAIADLAMNENAGPQTSQPFGDNLRRHERK